MHTDRRNFMKLSAAGAAALSTMSTGAWLSGCTSSNAASGMRFLRPEDVELLTALTPSVMAGHVGPGDTDKIDRTVKSFDTLLGDTSQIVVDLVMQAFDVLNFMPTRGLMTGQWSSWSKATVQDTDDALGRLRDSNIEPLNAIYAALIRLIASGYYLVPEYLASTGYPGPPTKVQGDLAQVEAGKVEGTP
ncbi:MAG: twin-arginine translocation signal domain-containing protein [Myxococcales bacterium]|nr:twin-arginine translocation signal domain-containing protein [Myxococcales bacterium]MDH3843180.1 twin-arginine translocation signal domain-containing protein [Myxococcales bacterium]